MQKEVNIGSFQKSRALNMDPKERGPSKKGLPVTEAAILCLVGCVWRLYHGSYSSPYDPCPVGLPEIMTVAHMGIMVCPPVKSFLGIHAVARNIGSSDGGLSDRRCWCVSFPRSQASHSQQELYSSLNFL